MLSFLFYASLPFALIGLLAFGMFGASRKEILFRTAHICTIASIVCLTGVLVVLFSQQGTAMATSTASRFIFAAWITMMVNLVAIHRFQVRLLGAIVMPVSFLLLLHAIFATKDPVGTLAPQPLPVYLHIVFVFLGLALILVAFGAALLRLIKARNLKRRKLDDRLPALTRLDRHLVAAFDGGFLLLTCGILLGFASGWLWDAKVVTAAVIWVAYGALFVAFHLGQASGDGLARGVIVLFIAISLSFVFAGHGDVHVKESVPNQHAPAP